MILDNDREKLANSKYLEELQCPIEDLEMITVFQRPKEGHQDYCIDSFLIPTDMLRQPTTNLDWDWEFDLVGMPIFVDSEDKRLYEGGKFGFRANFRFDDRVKRLILPRRFKAIEKYRIELCQDFYLFHNLHYNEETGNYVKFDSERNETVIVVAKPHHVKMRYKEINQFLLSKRMHLSIRFDCREYSQYSLNDLGFSKGQSTTVKTEMLQNGSMHSNCFYSDDLSNNYWTQGEGLQVNRLRNIFDYDENFIEDRPETIHEKPRNIFYRTIDSNIYGLNTPYHQKLLVITTPKDKKSDICQSYSVLYGRRLIGLSDIPKQESVKFIIDIDEYDTEITRSYDTYKSKHKNFAHFHKRVLDKYYHYYHTYLVGDTYLICQDHGAWFHNMQMGIWLTGDPRFLSYHGQWLIRIDDDHDDRVCVSLEELWKLPTEEQRHWRSYNIPPTGNVSKTYVTRYEKFQQATSNRPDHLFRESYYRLQNTCKGKSFWNFLSNPLNAKNEHYLRCLRVPSDSDTEYHLFLSLEIILNESLKLGKNKNRERLKNIQGFTEQGHLKFLKNVNKWRNEWDGHIGKNDYHINVKKLSKDFGVSSQNLREIYAKALSQGVDLLEFINNRIR